MEFSKRRIKFNLVDKEELAQVNRDLEANPFGPPTQAYVVSLQHEIRKVELYKPRGAQLLA